MPCALESSYSERAARRFCGRHTGPVAVEFTVFLRATLQPPLSTGVEHTLAVETISLLSSLPTPMCEHRSGRERETEGAGAKGKTSLFGRFSLARTDDVPNNDFNHELNERIHGTSQFSATACTLCPALEKLVDALMTVIHRGRIVRKPTWRNGLSKVTHPSPPSLPPPRPLFRRMHANP